MKKVFFCILFLVGILYAEDAVYREIEDTSDLPILSHSLKDRKFAKIELKNGLFAYLISDPEADQSAAALAVAAGSWNNPDEYPGMAHLLEHMLFLGTEKYPDQNAFSKFLSDHAGKSNAYTASDRTVYMFSVNNDSFFEALDRFSHFFIDPLLKGESIGTELFNVDQEHAKNIENDLWRAYMISKETGNQNHPNRGFSTGNSETLGNVPEEAMRSWYKNNYSAHGMRLVLYSSESIEELKRKATLLFCRVPKRSKEFLSIDEPLFSEEQIGHLTVIKPVKDLQQLQIVWELPKKFVDDDSKSAELIGYALSRGQKHSLSECLKKEGLIDALSIETETLGKHHIVFEISCDLTDAGMENTTLVTQKCFEALLSLKSGGIPSYLFDEMVRSLKLEYQYQSRKDAFSFTSSLAGKILDEPLSSFPRKTLLPAHYNAKNVTEILAYLTPKNAQYVLIGSPEKTKVSPNRKEQWMGAEYAIKKIDAETLNSWETISLQGNIKLAPPNPYVPIDLKIVKGSTFAEPFKLLDNDEGKIFVLKDDEFKTPEIAHFLHVKSPLIGKDARSQTLVDIYFSHLTKTLSPTLKCASAGGLTAEFGQSQKALCIAITGFSEKAPLFMEELFKEMAEARPDEKEFELIKGALSKDYVNSEKDLPIRQAMELLSSLIKDDMVTNREKALALQSISFDDYLTFQEELFDNSYVEGFFTGNLTIKDVESTLLDMQHIFESKPYPKREQTPRKILSLPENLGPHYVKKNTYAAGNGVLLALDEGNFTFEKRAAQTILSKALHEGFFHTLRTTQQTAYIAASVDREMEKHLYQYFLVQSNTHDSLDLIYRFELFLEDFVQNLSKNIPEERFSMIKESLITVLEKPHRNLEEKAVFLDMMAFSYDEDFSWRKKRKESLENLSYEDFLIIAKDFISRQNKKRLGVIVSGNLPDLFSYENISLENLRDIGSYEEREPFFAPSKKTR